MTLITDFRKAVEQSIATDQRILLAANRLEKLEQTGRLAAIPRNYQKRVRGFIKSAKEGAEIASYFCDAVEALDNAAVTPR